jgi:hypothetical protein
MRLTELILFLCADGEDEGHEDLLLAPDPIEELAQRLKACKPAHSLPTPVTPEVAGSSPVAPRRVQPCITPPPP